MLDLTSKYATIGFARVDYWLSIRIVGALLFSPGVAFPAEKEEPDFAKDIRPIIEKHCYECHNDQKQKGDLNLAHFDSIEKIHAAREIWQTVFERVQAFEMPPEGKNE